VSVSARPWRLENPSFESKPAGFGWLKSGIGIRARRLMGHYKDATPNQPLTRQRRVTRHCQTGAWSEIEESPVVPELKLD